MKVSKSSTEETHTSMPVREGGKDDTYREISGSIDTPVFQSSKIICPSSPIFFFIATCTVPNIAFKFLPNVTLKRQDTLI